MQPSKSIDTSAEDLRYLKLAKDPVKNREILQLMVNEFDDRCGANKAEVRPIDYYGDRRWTVFVGGEEVTNDPKLPVRTREEAESLADEMADNWRLSPIEYDAQVNVIPLSARFSDLEVRPRRFLT